MESTWELDKLLKNYWLFFKSLSSSFSSSSPSPSSSPSSSSYSSLSYSPFSSSSPPLSFFSSSSSISSFSYFFSSFSYFILFLFSVKSILIVSLSNIILFNYYTVKLLSSGILTLNKVKIAKYYLTEYFIRCFKVNL